LTTKCSVKNFFSGDQNIRGTSHNFAAHFRIWAIKSEHGRFGLFGLWPSNFGSLISCLSSKPSNFGGGNFSKRNPRLHHSQRPWIHPRKNDTLLAVAKFAQILFMRRPRVIERIVNMLTGG